MCRKFEFNNSNHNILIGEKKTNRNLVLLVNMRNHNDSNEFKLHSIQVGGSAISISIAQT